MGFSIYLVWTMLVGKLRIDAKSSMAIPYILKFYQVIWAAQSYQLK